MNPVQLSLFNYLSGAHVSVTATSLLPNGNLEILKVHIFHRERMGVLVSPRASGVLDHGTFIPNDQVLVITSILSLVAAFSLLLAIAVSTPTPV